MQFMLSMYYQEAADAGFTEEDMKPAMEAFGHYARALTDAGVLVSTSVLKPVDAATTITLRTGSLQVQDGPFIDSKERLGGAFVVDVADLDAALAWAERCPGAQWGSVEVRPVALTVVDGVWVPAD